MDRQTGDTAVQKARPDSTASQKMLQYLPELTKKDVDVEQMYEHRSHKPLPVVESMANN